MLLLVEKFNNQDENSKYNSMETIYLYLNGYNPEYLYRWTVIDNMFIAVLYIITLLISVGAAYLSFSCKWGGIVNNIIIRILQEHPTAVRVAFTSTKFLKCSSNIYHVLTSSNTIL